MTDSEVFNLLFNGGAFALPYLISFSNSDTEINLVNNNEDISFNNKTYKASSFNYTRPDNTGNGGALTITGIDNELIEYNEDTSGGSFKLEVIGVINKLDGTIQQLRCYKHLYGSVSFSDNMELEYTLNKDDRLELSFIPYVLDTDTNRANA